jgi:NAD-dependent deacetylase
MRSEANDSLIYPVEGNIELGDCAEDGAQLRPHIVWFEEEVPMMEFAIQLAYMADLFIVIGTSLVVYPAASILNYLPPFTPIIVMDKKLPIIQRANVYQIEKLATKGITDLLKQIDKVLLS